MYIYKPFGVCRKLSFKDIQNNSLFTGADLKWNQYSSKVNIILRSKGHSGSKHSYSIWSWICFRMTNMRFTARISRDFDIWWNSGWKWMLWRLQTSWRKRPLSHCQHSSPSLERPVPRLVRNYVHSLDWLCYR